MRVKRLLFFLFSAFTIFSWFFSSFVLAVTDEECSKKAGEEKVACYVDLVKETGEKKESLAAEIDHFDAQIALTAAQISQSEQKIAVLEEEIAGLSSKIDRLNTSLDRVSAILVNRISKTYKTGKVDPLLLFFSSDSFSQFLSRYKYLKVIQMHDKRLLLAMEETKTNYEAQKSLKEEKQEEVEQLKKVLELQKSKLAQQKRDKEYLLEATRQDEKRYQQLLAAARAEFEALQAIMAGRGTEEEVGRVNAGDKIATVIPGASCNSSGEHLHFMVSENGTTHNPFAYLKSVEYENCSGSSCSSGDGDSFNPSGDWDWPLNLPIRFSQGYGNTWAVNHTWVSRIYSFHNGIDIQGPSSEVKAVKTGILYRGSYTGLGGCRLQYVRVVHDDSNLETIYAHVYYL